MTGAPWAVTAEGAVDGAYELCKERGTAPALPSIGTGAAVAVVAAAAVAGGFGGNAVDASVVDRASTMGDGASDVAAESAGEDMVCCLKAACHIGAGAEAARDNVLAGT